MRKLDSKIKEVSSLLPYESARNSTCNSCKMLLPQLMKPQMLSAKKHLESNSSSSTPRTRRWKTCLETLLRVKLSFTKQWVCFSCSIEKYSYRVLSGNGRVGPYHSYNTADSCGHIIYYPPSSTLYTSFLTIMTSLTNKVGLFMEPLNLSCVAISPRILGLRQTTSERISWIHALDEPAHTLTIPVLTARNMCISASSEVPDVVFCNSAGTHGGCSYISMSQREILYLTAYAYFGLGGCGYGVIFQFDNDGEIYIILKLPVKQDSWSTLRRTYLQVPIDQGLILSCWF